MKAKLHFVLPITIIFTWFYGRAQYDYWKPVTSSSVQAATSSKTEVEYYELQETLFTKSLKATEQSEHVSQEVYFPYENGQFMAFHVQETSVLHPDLASKYPMIKSYTGWNSEGNLKIRFSVSHKGVQGMLIDKKNGNTTFLQKSAKNTNAYMVYRSKDLQSKTSGFECKTRAMAPKIFQRAAAVVDDQTLRTFRIAVSATGEYTDYHGGTVADALAAINATLTRVNEIFENDLGVTLELVANNDQVIYTDAATDPYNGSLNAEVQNTLTTNIGEANYDVGHLFHRDNDNGNAGFIGSVCVDNRKGSAFSSALVPETDLFDLDYVAHELGHQFGANHTWSFESEGTGVQSEPASGTTIMGYAGIVSGNNVASNGDDYFHYHSVVQIADYLQSVSCAQTSALANTPPVINPLPDYVIPKSTAFVLTGDANDNDSADVLTYTWEQIDNGVVTTTSFGPDNAVGANFRSLGPTTSPSRYFPALSRIVSGNLTQTEPSEGDAWETVSSIQRELNFAFTVRDNATGGGQVVSDLVKIDVVNAAGPFLVTSQSSSETYSAGSIQEITWDVADTDKAPINAETVDIFLSLDGGNTFPVVLAEDELNDGSAQVQLSADATNSARIMVKASNNVFLAVNTSNFTIQQSQVVLDFESLNHEICRPNDLVVPFNYETFSGFNETVTFSAMNVPPGLSVSFLPNTASSNSTPVAITFANTAGMAIGEYAIEVVASSSGQTTSNTITLKVLDANHSNITLISPTDLEVSPQVNPTFTWTANDNATAYDIEIATDNLFSTIIESATVPFASYRPSTLEASTTYFWRVRPKNSCGDGAFGSPFSFTTSVVDCRTVDGLGLPIEISVTETPTITSSVTFAEDLIVSDINVDLEVDHTFLEDLIISLISPSGTKVPLISKSCGNLNNINAIFDDSGTTISCGGDPGISGTVQPLGSLASFNGESLLGEWTLEIQDTAASDGGALVAFSLDVCAEGTFRPDDDEDGVFDDGDDLCLGTPKGTEVDTSGCPVNRFATDNFSIRIQSESCRANDNGLIEITAQDNAITYTAALDGMGVMQNANFTTSLVFENLAAGNYSLCITGTNGSIDYEATCFEIVIGEPETLLVIAALQESGQQVLLTLDGANLYTIEHNGIISQTEASETLIDLKPGLNTLKVRTELPCQGTYEEVFFTSSKPILYPNPVDTETSIFLNVTIERATVQLYTVDGRLIRKQEYSQTGNELVVDFNGLPSGIYYLDVQMEGFRETYKVLKR